MNTVWIQTTPLEFTLYTAGCIALGLSFGIFAGYLAWHFIPGRVAASAERTEP